MSAQIAHEPPHMAIIRVDRNLLAHALELPPETTIINIYMDSARPTDVYMVVDHPDLPETKEGTRPPEVSPVVKIEFDWGLGEK